MKSPEPLPDREVEFAKQCALRLVRTMVGDLETFFVEDGVFTAYEHLMALPPTERLRAAASLLESGNEATCRLGRELARKALEEEALAAARRELHAAAARVAAHQHAMQAGEPVA